MYKLTISNVSADKRGDSLNGIFESIPEAIEHVINQYRTFQDLRVILVGPTRWNVTITPIMTSYLFVMDEISFTELADAKKEELGLEVYDTAIPITWCDSVKQMTGVWPQHFVWGYKKGAFGFPVPLTPAAEKLLERYQFELNEAKV